MVIVAAKMDDSTERIIRSLRNKYEVDINILFFNVFVHGSKRLISRVWFEKDAEEQKPAPKSIRSWNQEYYVSFGSGERHWEDAQTYGFISAGGGSWYSNTLKLLSPGDRVWVNIPHTGYVGVSIVSRESQQAKDVLFDINGNQLGFSQLGVQGNYLYSQDDPAKAEYVVQVNWLKTVPAAQAVKEVGFFGNQNSVYRPRGQKWEYTVERLKKSGASIPKQKSNYRKHSDHSLCFLFVALVQQLEQKHRKRPYSEVKFTYPDVPAAQTSIENLRIISDSIHRLAPNLRGPGTLKPAEPSAMLGNFVSSRTSANSIQLSAK